MPKIRFEGPWWESTLKIVRIFVFAGGSGVVAYLLDRIASVPVTPIVIAGTTLLEWINQYLRERSRLRKEKVSGLLPF